MMRMPAGYSGRSSLSFDEIVGHDAVGAHVPEPLLRLLQPILQQTGHVLEAMPSEHGRPIQLDRIACDFPNLVLVGTHTGYPWVDEMIAVTTKWPNVYLSTSAWLPKYFTPSLVGFLNSRTGAQKVLYGSNGLSWQRYLDQVEGMELREDTKRKFLVDNPRKVFKL